MKNLVIILSSILISINVLAGTPPDTVVKAFQQKFPSATKVSWGMENSTEWEAEFKLGETGISANFLNDGTWVETETEIPVSKLPETVMASIKKDYPSWEITGGDRIESAKRGILFEADLKSGMKKKEVQLKEDGTFVK